MTMISQYYANVGIDFDVNSLKRAQTYMKRIEKTLEGFKKRSEKITSVSLKVRVDRVSMIKTLNTDIARISRNIVIPLNRFKINRNSLSRAISQATSGTRGAIRLDASLSQSSLNHMRQQVRNALSGMQISPLINPRVRGASAVGGGSSGGGGSRSPNHNPLMIGGAAGSIMRYGVYALPFVGGAYGLNTMATTAQELQSNRIILSGVAQGTTGGKDGEYYSGFLGNLGDRLGMTTRSLTPQFTQMLAASRGTSLEGQLENNFGTFMEYAAGMGLSEDKQKRSLYAITQMIGKGTMQSEEVKQQLGDVMPTFLPMLARAVTGTSDEAGIAKLTDMMKKGQVGTAKYLPLVMREMAKESSALMPGYFSSINYARGNSARQQEKWAIDFMAGGGEEAVRSFWETFSAASESTMFSAKGFGNMANRASNFLQGAMLVGPELSDWMRGVSGEGNLFNFLFGSSNDTQIIPAIKKFGSAADDWASAILDTAIPATRDLGGFIRTTLIPALGSVGSGVLDYFSTGLSAAGRIYSGDITGENIGKALGLHQMGQLANRARVGMFGGVHESFMNNTAPGKSLPTNSEAANNVMGGTGILDKISNQYSPTVTITNQMNFTVDSADSAEKIRSVVIQTSQDAYDTVFRQNFTTFPKIPQ